MATLSFEGETQGELVVKVRRWLASVEGRSSDGTDHLDYADALSQGAEVTKEALRIIAASAPEPVAEHEVVKALTGMGYKATEATRVALTDGLDSVEEITGGSVVRMAREAGRNAAYQMSSVMARQVLGQLKPR